MIYLSSVVIWIGSPSREEKCAVLGNINGSASGLPHEDIHQRPTDLDIMPAVTTLVLATNQHAELTTDVLVTSIHQFLHVESSTLQFTKEAGHHIARRAICRHVQKVTPSRINLTATKHKQCLFVSGVFSSSNFDYAWHKE